MSSQHTVNTIFKSIIIMNDLGMYGISRKDVVRVG